MGCNNKKCVCQWLFTNGSVSDVGAEQQMVVINLCGKSLTCTSLHAPSICLWWKVHKTDTNDDVITIVESIAATKIFVTGSAAKKVMGLQ